MAPVTRTLLVAVSLYAGGSLMATAQAPGAPEACALLPSAEVARLTGRDALAGARQIAGEGDTPGSTNCGYPGSSLYVDVQPLASIESFNGAAERLVKSGEFEVYPGLGDAAWFRNNESLGQHGFVVRVDRNLVTIMIDTSEAGSADSARAQLLPLAEAVVTKLR